MNGKSSPTDPTTPCDKCGGGTYTLPGGSIWCPDEDAHPGGYFNSRVAFERPPNRDLKPREWSKQPARPARETTPRRASKPTSKVVKTKVEDDGFNVGYDAFIGKD